MKSMMTAIRESKLRGNRETKKTLDISEIN